MGRLAVWAVTKLTKPLSTNEQQNGQAGTPAEPASQQSHGNPVVDRWHKWGGGSARRRRFRARVKTTSQRFGKIVWRAFEHNEIINLDVFTPPASYCARGLSESVVSTLLMFEGDVWVLTAAQLIEARNRGLFVRLPHLTEDEISDRDKGNLLPKLLALLQVSWMAIQIIARATLQISSTPLEIMAVSFAACALITYVLLLNHPQDVNTSIYIDASRLPTVYEMGEIAELSPIYHSFPRNRLPCIPNNSIHVSHEEDVHTRGTSSGLFNIGLSAGAAVFGGIHLVAWNFVFPTVAEQTLWRVSSLITLLVPLATILVTLGSHKITGHFDIGDTSSFGIDHWGQAFTGLGMVALVLTRLFLIVEAFRSLYYLPPDAYFATWAANAPYIA